METSPAQRPGDGRQGDHSPAEDLFPALYADLHRLARRELARHQGARLGATSLLHETYLDMAGRESVAFPDRARFLAYAARVMRGLIIDDARRRQSRKRGGQFEITSLPTDVPDRRPDADELRRIGAAIDGLARVEPELAELVDLKFFCGLSLIEIAALRGVTERTAQRHWDKARVYLHRALLEQVEPQAAS